MKKLLFKIGIFIYLSLFAFVSYIITITCLENKTDTSIGILVGYYLIFGLSVISFIRNGIKSIKARPKFGKIRLTKEKVLKGGAFTIYLVLFALASYVLIRMRMKNLPVFKWFIGYMIVFVIPCWNLLNRHILKLHAKIEHSYFKSPEEWLNHLETMCKYSQRNREYRNNSSDYSSIFSSNEESYYDREARELNEHNAYLASQKQLDDLGNCHRW